MYVQRNIDARSCNHFFLQWKSNKYYIFWVCAYSLRYPACNAHAPYCHLWSVRLYYIFPHYLINGRISKKKSYWVQNVCFDFLYNFLLKHFSFYEELCEVWSKIYVGLHMEYSLFLSDFNETWIFWPDFRNSQVSLKPDKNNGYFHQDYAHLWHLT
jgi:hypothetical protein